MCKQFSLFSATHPPFSEMNQFGLKLDFPWHSNMGANAWFLLILISRVCQLAKCNAGKNPWPFLVLTPSPGSFLRSRLTSSRLQFSIATVQRHPACGWNESHDRMPRRWLLFYQASIGMLRRFSLSWNSGRYEHPGSNSCNHHLASRANLLWVLSFDF